MNLLFQQYNKYQEVSKPSSSQCVECKTAGIHRTSLGGSE